MVPRRRREPDGGWASRLEVVDASPPSNVCGEFRQVPREGR